jgi:hypothetical protein
MQMEEPIKEKDPPTEKNKKGTKERSEVITVRTWKEYVEECALIVFSVVLALVVTEAFNKRHENQHIKEVLHQLHEELIENKRSETEQYAYHSEILRKIDSALNDPTIANKFIAGGKVDLNIITPPPHGLLLHDLNDVAWEVAKQNNIFSKLDLETYSLLTDIYNNQDRITKSEDEIAKVLLAWESRKPENIRTTLILVRDNFQGWATGRAPGLLNLYQRAIDKLSKY